MNLQRTCKSAETQSDTTLRCVVKSFCWKTGKASGYASAFQAVSPLSDRTTLVTHLVGRLFSEVKAEHKTPEGISVSYIVSFGVCKTVMRVIYNETSRKTLGTRQNNTFSVRWWFVPLRTPCLHTNTDNVAHPDYLLRLRR